MRFCFVQREERLEASLAQSEEPVGQVKRHVEASKCKTDRTEQIPKVLVVGRT